MPPRLFWNAPGASEGQEIQSLTSGAGPERQTALPVSGTDILYPAPGGGVLRVPVGGGEAEELRGDERGQLIFWSEAESRWIRTLGEPQDRDVPVFNELTQAWEYGPQQGLGELEYFGLSHSPVGLWNFNDTLADQSGNGNDLQLAVGSLAFCDVIPGKRGLFVLQNSGYSTAAAAAELAILGDMTLEAIVQFDSYGTGDSRIARYTDTGETEAENCCYSVTVPTTSGTELKRIQWFSEHGAGINDTADSAGDVSLPPVHNMVFLAVRRQSNVIRFYVNGRQFGPDSAALTAPTGGGGAGNRLMVGGSTPVSPQSPTPFLLFSLKIVPSALTDAEVLAEYNRTVGPAFGLLT